MKSKIPRSFIFLFVVALLLAVIWPKVKIVFFIPLTLWQAVLLFGGGAVVLFLIIDHFINRTRD
ncbi:MAG: hypothetical protein Kow0080_30000 [Candidatus Promineifilaceae bacterium]